MSDELNAAALSEIASFLNNEHQDSLLAIGRGLVAVDTVWAELSHVANDHCSIRVGIGNTVEEHRCMASRCRRLGVGVSVSRCRRLERRKPRVTFDTSTATSKHSPTQLGLLTAMSTAS